MRLDEAVETFELAGGGVTLLDLVLMSFVVVMFFAAWAPTLRCMLWYFVVCAGGSGSEDG